MRDMSPHESAYKEKGVEMIAVNAFEDPAVSKQWIASSGLDLHWAFASAEVTDAFGVAQVPTQIILDREGKVAWTSSFSSLIGGSDAILAELDALL